MCIFSAPVISVSGTTIFVATNQEQNKIRVVYSNSVACQNGNVMILPVESDNVKLIELDDEFKNFSRDLNKEYELIFNPPMLNKNFVSDGYESENNVVIIKYGPYDVSLTKQLHKVDWDHFGGLENKTEFYELMNNKYHNYFFLIAKIRPDINTEQDADSESKLPICYEFTPKSNKVLIPTFHIHDGHPESAPEWDHLICVLNGSIFNYDDNMTEVDYKSIYRYFKSINKIAKYYHQTGFNVELNYLKFLKIKTDEDNTDFPNIDLLCFFKDIKLETNKKTKIEPVKIINKEDSPESEMSELDSDEEIMILDNSQELSNLLYVAIFVVFILLIYVYFRTT
jgi:hypothetical protein